MTVVDPIINILSSFGMREFSYSQFVNAFNNLNMCDDINVDFVLNVLYDCSAIGHAYPYKNGRETRVTFNPNRSLEIFSCEKSDYSRRCHRYSICILTQYVSFVQFQDKMKAKFSNDRFGFKYHNRHSSFNKENRIILHKGLWKALNVNF